MLGKRPIDAGDSARTYLTARFEGDGVSTRHGGTRFRAKERVAAEGVRVLIRKSGVSQHTIEAIREGLSVRHMTLQRVIAALGPEPFVAGQ